MGHYPAAGRSTDDPRSGIPRFQHPAEEEVKNIQRTAELLLEVNLGATAIGTGLNTPKEYSPLAVKNWLKLLASHAYRLKT